MGTVVEVVRRELRLVGRRLMSPTAASSTSLSLTDAYFGSGGAPPTYRR